MYEHSFLVVANQAEAYIYAVRERGTELQLRHSMANQYGRSDDQDIYTDRQGRQSAPAAQVPGVDAMSRKDAVKVEAERFAGDIADWLEQKRISDDIQHLDIIAEPSFLGKLRDKLSKSLSKQLDVEIPKDVVTASPEQLLRYLKDGN